MPNFSRVKIWASEHRLPIVIVIGVVAAVSFVFFSPTFQECVQANQSGEGHHSPYESFAHILWVTHWCGGIFVKENSEWITALATVVMAIFTGTLWWSTASTAKLTEKTVALAEKQFLMEGRQADLAERQHGLARLQHIAANKPLLRIRGITLGSPIVHNELFVKGQKVVGSLVVASRP